jgi:uncharacterized protein YbjT (DUF2867 family)
MVAVVFGARGNVGRHVAAGLAAAGARVRVTSRDPATARFPAGTDVAAADLEEPGTLPAALAGAQSVFLYARPAGIQGLVQAAQAAGVRHIAFLSSAAVVSPGAEHNPIAQQHKAVELALEGSGIEWTFIRPGMFAANTRWLWAQSVRTARTVRTPYPGAQTAPIHEKDIAALAVTALTEPGHGHQAYTVFGPESLTLRDQVRQIADAIGTDIRLEVVSREQAQEELGKTLPAMAAAGILRGWEAGNGAPARTSVIVEKITGRPARTFAEWAADHADDFR